ncbi:alpha/beta hydrolase-fold protein [Niabella sp.]|uniref:alpha/beta hydrolase n=1 Tax=Niabella sp. TaxID=1962976 RepID=UPI002607CDAB|nr:alpha/beta hydrolase-fold protein [Niabella sp.]
MRYTILLALVLFVIACNAPGGIAPDIKKSLSARDTLHFYSKNVKDSFTIYVNLPADYLADSSKHFPVVYLLDANLYFDIMATVLNNYTAVGLAPPVILAGIGYKDFQTMDSLRNRDYTFPTAIPEYEMPVSGGAPQFLNFINTELAPAIDKRFRTDTLQQTLMGHSLGGYFTCYALQQRLAGKQYRFRNYIAASPSLHYNNYFLPNELKKAVPVQHDSLNVYITFGGLEKQDSLCRQLPLLLPSGITKKIDIYSALDHMDTQLPSFVKGLQWQAEASKP